MSLSISSLLYRGIALQHNHGRGSDTGARDDSSSSDGGDTW